MHKQDFKQNGMDRTMQKANMTPEESLLLISKTIEETKRRFEENGHIIIMWGVLMFTVFFSQHVFVLLDWHKSFDIIWTTALFPLGAIYTFIYTRKTIQKKNLSVTLLTRVIGAMGWAMGMNLLILGLLFSQQLGDAMAPVFMILLALSMIVIGASIKFRPIFIGGLLLNLIGLFSFYVDPKYYGFSLMLGAVIGLIIPGLLLNRAKRKEHA